MVWEAHEQLPARLRRLPIFLGISGGRDSTLLAHLATRLVPQLPPLHLLHVNYGLRIPDADRDEAWVREIAEQAGLSLFVKRLHPKLKPANLQDWARTQRLRFFHQIIQKQNQGRGLLWLAHHQQDQAETVLERMIRGSGLRGLGGMQLLDEIGQLGTGRLVPPLRIFRPMLAISSAQIQGYVERHQIQYRLDLSNTTRDYRRNRIRHDILPLLEKENPAVAASLAQLAKRARGAQDYLHRQALSWWKRHGQKRIPTQGLGKLVPALREEVVWIYLTANLDGPFPFSKIMPQVEGFLEKGFPKQEILLPKGYRLLLNEKEISVKK